MTKTPVSILQEMMVQRKMVPKFELIHDGGGTHVNTFTYQVSCDGLVATGTGNSKKEAKHEAAKAMLEKIPVTKAELPESLVPSQKRPLPTEVTDSPSKRARNIQALNALAALNQLCLDKKLPVPSFEVKDAGPSHIPIFTAKCVVSTFKAEGIAKTKKEAKREAAKKILEKIQAQGNATVKKQVPPEAAKKIVEKIQAQGNGTAKMEAPPEAAKTTLEKVQPKIENLQNSDLVDLPSEKLEEALAKAAVRCSTLTKNKDLDQIKVNCGIKLEAPKYVKRNYDEDTRCEILKQLDNLKEYIDNADNDVTKEFVDELREKFIKFLKPLNMTYYSHKIEKMSSQKCLMLVEVATNPDIAEVGVADYHHLAEMNAIKQILHTLTEFL